MGGLPAASRGPSSGYSRSRASACTPARGTASGKSRWVRPERPGRRPATKRACRRSPKSSPSTLKELAAASPAFLTSTCTSSASSVTATVPETSNRGVAPSPPAESRRRGKASSMGATEGRLARRSLSRLDGHKRDPRLHEGGVQLGALLAVGGEHLDRARLLGVLLQGRELAHPLGLHDHVEGAGASGLELVVHRLQVVLDGLHLPLAGTRDGAAVADPGEGHVHELVEVLPRPPEVDAGGGHLVVVGNRRAEGDRLLGDGAGERLVVDDRRVVRPRRHGKDEEAQGQHDPDLHRVGPPPYFQLTLFRYVSPRRVVTAASICQVLVSSFQISPATVKRVAFCLGATFVVVGATGAWNLRPLMVVVMVMLRISMGAFPSFMSTMLTAYLSPAFTAWGLTSKLSLPGSSAACVPFLTVTPAESSKPSGTAPARPSGLEVWVLPATKLRPAGRAGPVDAASESALAVIAPILPWVAVLFPESSLSASS